MDSGDFGASQCCSVVLQASYNQEIAAGRSKLRTVTMKAVLHRWFTFAQTRALANWRLNMVCRHSLWIITARLLSMESFVTT